MCVFNTEVSKQVLLDLCFGIYPAIPCLLTGEFNPFMFNLIFNRQELIFYAWSSLHLKLFIGLLTLGQLL